jgi:hypothetical protein
VGGERAHPDHGGEDRQAEHDVVGVEAVGVVGVPRQAVQIGMNSPAVLRNRVGVVLQVGPGLPKLRPAAK